MNQVTLNQNEISSVPKQRKKTSSKKAKVKKNVKPVTSVCNNCLSSMKLNPYGVLECTGDNLKFWEDEFVSFSKLGEKNKGDYLSNLSNYSRFIELYDRWKYSQSSPSTEEFNCGYINALFPVTGTTNVRIPDPLVVKRLEAKLGRLLTEEELIGESELWLYGGMVLTNWRKRAKQVKIPYIILPSEETVFI